MTTYGTDLRMGSSPRTNTATIQRTGSLGTGSQLRGQSVIKPFNRNPVAVTPKPANNIAPFNRGANNNLRNLGKTASVAKAAAGTVGKKVVGKLTPGIGINSKGDLDIGLRALGTGVSISIKGDISLSILGVISATADPKNSNNSKIEYGLGAVTIESTQDGCTITVTSRILGKIQNQTTRKADGCVEPEPTPTPTPTPSPTPSPSPEPDTPPNPLPPKQPKNQNIPPPNYNGPLYTESYGTYHGLVHSGAIWALQLTTAPMGGVTHYPLVVDNPNSANYADVVFSVYPEDPVLVIYNVNFGAIDGIGTELPDPHFPFNQTDRTFRGMLYHTTYVSGIYYGARLIERKLRPPVNKTTTLPIGRIMPEESCDCELLEDIYDMLGGDDFRDDGLEIPNHLFIPGGTGETKALTYNALLNLMFRTLDHRTVGEVEVSIKDNNIMKEGDQGLTMKLVNATAATGKILELSQKQDSDLTAVLNLLMRLSWISVQILKVVNIGSEATKTIVSFFAIPVKEKVINVDIPVDPSLGGKIGFDPKKPSQDQLIKILDLDDPQKTISIFDKFMNNSKIPVKVKQFIGDRSGGNYWWLMDKNKK